MCYLMQPYDETFILLVAALDHVLPGVEINTGPVARGQLISCLASRICFVLARLASKILKPYFRVYMA